MGKERNLSTRALYYMAAQMLANVVGLATGMVLARVFTKAEMGDYVQLMFIYGLLSQILILGLPQSLTYFYATSEERHRPATVYFVTGLLFVLGLVIGAVTYTGAPWFAAWFKNPKLGVLVRDFFLFYAFTFGGSYLRRLSVLTNRYMFLMFWLPFDRVMMLASFALPALLGYGLETAVRVAVWIAAGKFAITTVYTLWVVPIRGFNWQKGLASKMLYYSIPLGLSAAVGAISSSIDKLVVGRYTPKEFFAVFSLGVTPIPFVAEIAESVMTVLIPVLASLHKEGRDRDFAGIWQESIRKTSIFILATLAFVEFFAVPLMVTLYGPQYAESALFFRLSKVGLLVRVTLYGGVLQALGRTRFILYWSFVTLATRPIVNIALFKAFETGSPGNGPVGMMAGSLVLTFVTVYVYVRCIKGALGYKGRSIWPWSYYMRILASATGAGAVAAVALAVPLSSISAWIGWATTTVAGPFMRTVEWMASFGSWHESVALTKAAAAAVSIVATRPSLATLVQLALGAAIFAPAYGALLHLTGSVKEKDWTLFRDTTYGKVLGVWRKLSRGAGALGTG